MVRRAELLDLPRAVRLERMCRQHELRARERAGEAAGKMRVPGVAVDDVGDWTSATMARSRTSASRSFA